MALNLDSTGTLGAYPSQGQRGRARHRETLMVPALFAESVAGVLVAESVADFASESVADYARRRFQSGYGWRRFFAADPVMGFFAAESVADFARRRFQSGYGWRRFFACPIP